jgi:hypothetical protein
MEYQSEDQVSSHGNFGETPKGKKIAVVDHKPEAKRLPVRKIKPSGLKKNEVQLPAARKRSSN